MIQIAIIEKRHRLPVRRMERQGTGIVSYGAYRGTRAAVQLRQTMGEIKIADVHAQVAINPYFDFTDSKAGVCPR